MVTDVQQVPAFPEALTWPEKAKALAIRDQSSYDLAANTKLDLAALRKKITEEFAPMKEAAHKAHKAICLKEAEYLAPITEAESVVISKLKAFHAEQERIRLAEEARLREIQRQAEEQDRLRREAEAKAIRDEELRVAAEIRAKDEELRLAAAIAASSEAEADAILAAPVLAVPEVAPLAAYIEPTPYTAPVIAAPTFDRVKGLGIKTTWAAQVTNLKLLARAVADGVVPENYIEPNMVALNGRARADKQALVIPGVRAVEK